MWRTQEHLDVLHSMGVTQQDLLQTDVCLYAANRNKLSILGMLPVIVSSKRVGTGELVETRQLLYVVEELGKLYVSREALQALGSVPLCFPEVPAHHVSAIEYVGEMIAKIAELETRAPCGCHSSRAATIPRRRPLILKQGRQYFNLEDDLK